MKKIFWVLSLTLALAAGAWAPARAAMPVDTIPIKWSVEKSHASVVVAAPNDSIVAVIYLGNVDPRTADTLRIYDAFDGKKSGSWQLRKLQELKQATLRRIQKG